MFDTVVATCLSPGTPSSSPTPSASARAIVMKPLRRLRRASEASSGSAWDSWSEPEQEAAFDLSTDQVRIDRYAAVEHEHDPLDVHTLAGIERDLGHVGAVAEKARAGDPARATLRWWRGPLGDVGRELQRAQG